MSSPPVRLARQLRAGTERAVVRLRRGLPGELAAELVRDRVPGLAAEVAFFAVLSVFPGLLLVAAGLGFLGEIAGPEISARSQELVLGFARAVFTERADRLLAALEDLFDQQRGGLATASALTSLWALARGFDAVVRVLELAYDLERRRPWARRKAVAAALSLGSAAAGVLLLGAFVAGPLLGGGRALAEALGLGTVFARAWEWARWPAGLAVLAAWAATVYHLGSGSRAAWRDEVPGAVAAALLGVAASAGFAAYVRGAPLGNPVLGTLGGGLVLLLWVYVLSFVLLLGGELNGLLQRRRKRGAASGGPRGNPFLLPGAPGRYRVGRAFHHSGALRRILALTDREGVGVALDVACGTGLSTLALAERADISVGVDQAEAMLRVATPRSNVTYVVGRAESLPFASGVFELITVSSAIHWFDQEAFFSEAHRVLAPCGSVAVYDHFLVGDADEGPLGEWLRDRFRRRYPSPPGSWRAGELDVPRGFVELGRFEYSTTAEMTHDGLIAHLLSCSGTIVAAVERETPRDMERWLRSETAGWFAGRAARAVRFRVVGRCYGRASTR